ncbi:hypothetical protein [Chryseobacterium sp. IT-36CA2]|uniref:hypothetical protein n=1 Tax=Chryseobacterium sp. IT-36CA2 TaxID=3026460 RepID=UPI0039E0AB51
MKKKKKTKKSNKALQDRVRIKNLALIPSSIRNYIDTMVKVYPPKLKYKCKIEFFYYIIITIIKRQNTFENKADRNIPVALYTDILKGIVSDYSGYLNWLVEMEVVELAVNYSVGHHSNKYCFTDFILMSFEKVPELEKVEMKVLESDKIIVERSIQDSDIYKENQHLLKWFNDKLEIDFDGALNFIDDYINEKYTYVSGDYRISIIEPEKVACKRMHWINHISKLHHKVFTATRNEESDFRLHTVLTNFKKIFKPFVTYDSKKLVAFDLKNSQPYFLVYLISNLSSNRSRYVVGLCRKVYGIRLCTFMLPILKETLSSKGFAEEFSQFQKWVLEGKLYENLALILKPEKCFTGGFTNVVFIKELKSKHPVSFGTERELLKSVFIRALFCKNDSTDEYYLKLKEKLPNFMAVLEILKSEDNAHLSRLLQNIESHCIIDYVTKKIAKEHPEMPLFTIHDSIATTIDFEAVLGELMVRYVEEFTGFKPKVAKESWDFEPCTGEETATKRLIK